MDDCHTVCHSPDFTQHAWVYTLTRCCVDFEIFNTCFVSGFTQYIQVQQHFRVYTIILRLSLRPREQYFISIDGATNAPVPLQGSSSSNNPRKGKAPHRRGSGEPTCSTGGSNCSKKVQKDSVTTQHTQGGAFILPEKSLNGL